MASKESKPTSKAGSYGADAITVLEGLEPVRKRPGMYIGTTGPEGLHHLVWEVFDNCRDEAMGGYADDIEVALLPENRIRVVDNGRGIPVDIHKQTKVSALETIMTTLHAGGKFGGEGYKVSGGLHGVGVSVVNALSTYTKAEVHRDGGKHVQEYLQGKRKAAVKKVGASKLHGTIITFEPDPEIFKEGIKFDWNKVVGHLRQQAYLVKDMRVTVLDLRNVDPKALKLDDVFYARDLLLDAPSMCFYFEGGLRSLITFYNQHQKAIHKNVFYCEKLDIDSNVVSVEVALQYVDDITARITTFANNTYNSEGGTHLTGFKTALTRTLNTYGRKSNLLKESEENFTGEDVLEGLTAVVSVKLREVQFEGQTKSKLGSVEAQSAVQTVFGEAFSMFLEENPDDAKSIILKSVLALKARKAAKAAKDSVLRKGALDGMTLPGKLADCQTKRAEESEIFIVEGDSAGGCFSGDTKVALVDGRDVSFIELIAEQAKGKQNYCYTISHDGTVAVAPIQHVRKTKTNTNVLKVVLDDGAEITCTPDHKFMLRDGTYREAQDLQENDSLMPLRRKMSVLGGRITIAGYEMVFDPSEHYWRFTHILADRYNIARGLYQRGHGEHAHHIDFNKCNNSPDNLVRLSKEAHLALHAAQVERTLHTPEAKEKARAAHKRPEYREKVREIMSTPQMSAQLRDRAQKQWADSEYKRFMTEKYRAFYEGNAEYREQNKDRLQKAQQAYWADALHRSEQAARTSAYFEAHGEAKEVRRTTAHEQWQDEQLREWRSATTRTQWTDAFRAQRKDSYNKTYLRKALTALHDIVASTGNVDLEAYEARRRVTGDRSLLRADTIANRFFDGDTQAMKDAAIHHNHRVRAVVPISEHMDVYDLEVPDTHNFALSSGVFVHNSAKMGRDRRTQAILPLKGKILNVERARLDRMLASDEIKALVVAMGTAIGDVFDISRLRYHKIIIATDADVDGAHIRTLLLTLFFRHFTPVIEGGFVYIAQPPLYKISKGKDARYAYDDDEKRAILKDMGIDERVMEEPSEEEAGENEAAPEEEVAEEVTTKRVPKATIQRYKGLGEMNPEELWETTMNPAHRVLKQVNIDDAVEANKVFETLMGTDVAARKSFIQSNAKMAELDI